MNFVDEEFEIAKSNGEWDILWDFIPEIKSLVDKFSKSGQSGFSAPYVARSLGHVVEKLCLKEPITSISDIEEDWFDFTGSGYYQHRRCSALFREGDGRPYYLDAVVFRDVNQMTYTSNYGVFTEDGTVIQSWQFVRFPFVPKTFYIDVYEKEGKTFVRDESKLDEVFGYYYNKVYDRDDKISDIVS